MRTLLTTFLFFNLVSCQVNRGELLESIREFGRTKGCFTDVSDVEIVDGDDTFFWGDADVVAYGKKQRIEFASRYDSGNRIETYYVSICEVMPGSQPLLDNQNTNYPISQ